uniref:Thymidylate kinase n=1 Tax=Otolemur garnettii TaxID=30611 RepID=H0XIF1_OTOGA
MAAQRGALIVLEGVDRAGKSTQARRLVSALCSAGRRAELLRFPAVVIVVWQSLAGFEPASSGVCGCAYDLKVSSETGWEEYRPLIKEKLSQGVTLIVDRYAFSGVAFTSAKENFSLDWCKQPDVGLPKPDLVLFLQLQLADAAVRGEFGQERYEDRPFQERALQCFHQLMADTTLNWKIVDASRSIEDIHMELLALCEDVICTAAQRPLGELWK